MGRLKYLLSREDRFFRLLEASAKEGRTSVRALEEILQAASPAISLDKFFEARDREWQIHMAIEVLLCAGYPSPLAPEDVEALAQTLYRIPKGIKKFAERYKLCLPRVQDVRFEQHLRMLASATDTLCRMLSGVKSGASLAAAKADRDMLQKIEGEADRLLVTSLAQLYRGQYEPVKALMLKDLYELLERVVDRCRRAGNILLQIAMKKS